MSNNSKIFVIYHKSDKPLKSDIYQPIAVGPNKDTFAGDFLRDDVGDNIAEKNDKYNELTAIYWVFKHIDEFKNVKYFGFDHYRRLFCFSNLNETVFVRKEINEKLINIDNDRLCQIFHDYDFVCPSPSYYRSVRKHYQRSHNKEDLDVLLEAINNISPKYKDDAEDYFDNSREFLYNMFIFKKEDFFEYCSFVFPVLEEFLKLKSDAQRLYVSERLTGIFINHLLNKGMSGLFLPVLHVRSKSLKTANKQVKENFKLNKDRGLFYKLKPIILCFLPRWVEQYFRRLKTR